jgi:hypothetical protein
LNIGDITAPGISECQRSGKTLEKFHPQFGLQAANLLRNGTLCHAELFAGNPEVQVPGGNFEGAKTVKRRKTANRLGHPIDFLLTEESETGWS